MDEQEAVALEIAAAIDSGRGLTVQQYRALLDSLGSAAQPGIRRLHELVNAVPLVGGTGASGGGGPVQPRIVLLAPDDAAAVTNPALIEQHLIAMHDANPDRRGVVVVQPEALQALKKRRTAARLEGVSYPGSHSFCGRFVLPLSQQKPG